MHSPTLHINTLLDFSSISDIQLNSSGHESSFFDETLQFSVDQDLPHYSDLSIQRKILSNTASIGYIKLDRNEYIETLETRLATSLHTIETLNKPSYLTDPKTNQFLNDLLIKNLLDECTRSLHISKQTLDSFYRTINHPDLLVSTKHKNSTIYKNQTKSPFIIDSSSTSTLINYKSIPIPQETLPKVDIDLDSFAHERINYNTHPLDIEINASFIDYCNYSDECESLLDPHSRQISRQQRIANEAESIVCDLVVVDSNRFEFSFEDEQTGNEKNLLKGDKRNMKLVDVIGGFLPNAWRFKK